METLYPVLKVVHVLGFVMMSVPLFNLIVVNERALMGAAFNYATDRFMENIIRHGAARCYVFQLTVLVSGLLMLALGPLGIQALWTNWVIAAKTLLMALLMGLLSIVHLRIQPAIESLLGGIGPASPIPEGFGAGLKPYRIQRKKMATFCLFLVLTSIILGMQVYARFQPGLTIGLVALAALFAVRANKTLIRFGWV